MKKINIILIFLVATLLVSCDNVPVSERKKAVDISSFKKPVVVIDFTGVACNNCPRAAETIKKMHEQAGDKIIGVAMYPDCSFNHTEFDLRSPEATQYYEAFGDIQKILLPSGIVDFFPYNDNVIIDVDLWGSAVSERIVKDIPIEVSIQAAIAGNTGDASRTLNITSTISTSQTIADNLSLILWLIEDNIVGTQNYYGTYIDNYVHNHVLRTSINGLWGESISIAPGTNSEKSTTYKATNDTWKLENCSVVGVVINSATKEIITAGKTKVSIN